MEDPRLEVLDSSLRVAHAVAHAFAFGRSHSFAIKVTQSLFDCLFKSA
jgi:hypothetical protein